jgi:hypothetical protein
MARREQRTKDHQTLKGRTQVPCYTESVDPGRTHNLTLAIEEDLLLAARELALARRTTVNQLVRQFLADLVQQADRRRSARERLKAMMEKGLVKVGKRTWKREDLYER